MSSIQFKRSNVAGKVPLPADLAVGALALNFKDKKLYTKEPGGSIIVLAAPVAAAAAAILQRPAAGISQDIQPAGTADVPLTLKGMAGQTGNLQEWQDSAGNAKSLITSAGQVCIARGIPVGNSVLTAYGPAYIRNLGVGIAPAADPIKLVVYGGDSTFQHDKGGVGTGISIRNSPLGGGGPATNAFIFFNMTGSPFYQRVYEGTGASNGYMTWDSPGGEKMRLTADGKALINTTVPLAGSTAKLQVDGGAALGKASSWPLRLWRNSTAPVGIQFTSTTTAHWAGIQYDNAGYNMAFTVDAAERMRINKHGMLGLGEPNPMNGITLKGPSHTGAPSNTSAKGATLALISNAATPGSGGEVTFAADSQLGFASIKGGLVSPLGSHTGNLKFYMRKLVSDAAMSEVMRIDPDGKVLINTTTTLSGSTAKLEVKGGAHLEADVAATMPLVLKGAAGQTGDLFRVDDSAGAHKFSVLANGDVRLQTAGYITYDAVNHNMSLKVGGKYERVRLTRQGQLCVGDYSPPGSAFLHVEGRINVKAETGNFGYFSVCDKNGVVLGRFGKVLAASDDTLFESTTGNDLVFNTNGANERMRINAAGQVMIDKSVPVGTHQLSVNGSIHATGNVVAYSDLSLKGNLVPITSALDKVDQIHGFTYERIDMNDGIRRAGVIAQDVQDVLPEAVSSDQKGLLSLDQGAVIGLLVEAIKELREELRALT